MSKHKVSGYRRMPLHKTYSRQIHDCRAQLSAHRDIFLTILVLLSHHQIAFWLSIDWIPALTEYPPTGVKLSKPAMPSTNTRHETCPPSDCATANTAIEKTDTIATWLSFGCGKIADDRLPVGSNHPGFPASGWHRLRRSARTFYHHHAVVL